MLLSSIPEILVRTQETFHPVFMRIMTHVQFSAFQKPGSEIFKTHREVLGCSVQLPLFGCFTHLFIYIFEYSTNLFIKVGSPLYKLNDEDFMNYNFKQMKGQEG